LAVNATGFGLFCLLGFLLPVPLIAWLDRPRKPPGDQPSAER
jgi:hypothetical protein